METLVSWLRQVLDTLLSGVFRLLRLYASFTGKSSYRPPEESAASAGSNADQPLVLLVTGSMIASDFFDVMALRLKQQGFRPVVYQPPDLLTGPIPSAAQGIDAAVKTILSVTGEEKLNVVAECNGGVAARYWLQRLGGARYVDRFITFVSAHHGTKSVGTCWYPALADIKPGSEYLEGICKSTLEECGVNAFSIYMSMDEIMKPCTTSQIRGALNIEVRDRAMDRRARDRWPYPVHSIVGWVLALLFPIHLAGFWDETFFRLVLSCLRDDPATICEFDELNVVTY